MIPKLDSKFVKQRIVAFIKDISDKTGTDGFVTGLSGGIDSTVVAYLLKEACSTDKIYSYHLSSSTTPKEDTEHARLVAKLLDIPYKEIAIDSITNEFLNLAYDTVSNSNKDDCHQNKAAEGNIKARVRMTILYYFANLKNSLVVGTGNRSELLIGYFTKFGDGACDFEPLADIYKTQLKKLAKDWNIPKEIIEKPPRAGLWNNQTDEDEIGFTYSVLDELLYFIVDKKLMNDDIMIELDISFSELDSIRKKITNNQHKLKSPPSPFENEKLF